MSSTASTLPSLAEVDSPEGLLHNGPGSAPESSELVLEQVCLRVRDRDILRSVDLVLPRRRVTALVGPSGSGKSSLLRVLNRLWDTVPGARVSGRVLYRGRDIYAHGADPVWIRSRIGLVFQRPAPFPRSIYDNIALPLRIHGKSPRQIPELVERALLQAALWDEVKDRLKSSALTLSGGQQQRLCIARALAVEPEVLLLDEPASALDPNSRSRIEELVLTLKGRLTVLLVTHHLDQAHRLGDYTAVMTEGKVLAFGRTADVFSDRANPDVHGYLQSPH